MTATGRDRVWSIALRIAQTAEERGFLREVTPEVVVDAVEDSDVDVSARTVRRVLDAMASTGILVDVGDRERRYRLADAVDEPDPSSLSSHSSTNVSSSDREVFDISVDDLPSLRDDVDLLIYHFYADAGVEAEPLSAYGRVVRVGLDPQRTPFSDALQADARDPPLDEEADLAVLHPPCQRWSRATRLSGDPEDHPDLLDDARDVADRLARDYILENVPEAPLDDPVVLDGRMFGLPIVYRRAFETSFSVPQPPRQADLVDQTGPFADDDGGVGDWRGDARLWRTAKQVSGDYPARELKHSGIPAPYIHYLARYWLRSRRSLEPSTNLSPERRRPVNGGERP